MKEFLGLEMFVLLFTWMSTVSGFSCDAMDLRTMMINIRQIQQEYTQLNEVMRGISNAFESKLNKSNTAHELLLNEMQRKVNECRIDNENQHYLIQSLQDQIIVLREELNKSATKIDTLAPTFDGSCGEVIFLDAMDNVTFRPGAPSDNVAVANLSQSSYIQPGDVITEDAWVTYTAEDFAGNSAKCTVFFKVIDRITKPILTCPDFVTLIIDESATTVEYEVNGILQSPYSIPDPTTYNTSSHISVSGGILTVTPPTVFVSTSNLRSALIISVTAENKHGTESTCKFMVNCKASECFPKQFFFDNNARRTCFKDGSDLICTSTCNTDYLYKDGTNEKNFTCTGEGNWNLSTNPNERYCLGSVNVEYEIPISEIYTLGFFSKSCLTQFSAAINRDLPVFKARLSTLCSGINWNVTVTRLGVTAQFSEFKVDFKLTLLTTSATIADRDACVAKIPNNQQTFDVDNRQLVCGASNYSLTASFPTKGTPVQTCTQNTYTKITSSVENGEICVSIGPGEFYNSLSDSVQPCLEGQYQDELAQTSCKTCPIGKFASADKTTCTTFPCYLSATSTCPDGFTSADGFVPCKPCSIDYYWVNTTTCVICSAGTSTLGRKGVASQSMCYDECPVGTYSRTGYNNDGCTPCPLNFYQDMTGQMICKECGVAQRTLQIGSSHTDNCTQISDACEDAFCNSRGFCDYAFHRRVCKCNSGYCGDRCEHEYHKCDENQIC